MNVLMIEVVQALVIIATGLALGWSTSARVLPAIAVLLLGTVAFAGIGLLMAGTLRAEANLALANGLFLVLMAFGGVFYSLDRLPAGLEVVARALPAAALSESLRAILEPGHAFPTGPLLVLTAWAIAMPLLAARFFRWEE
jgi:ABC-2 type transport system permease protein